MASSSSNPSSTSPSTSSTPSAARVRPPLPTRAAAPAESAARGVGVAPGASASAPNFAPDASATAPGVAAGAIASTSTSAPSRNRCPDPQVVFAAPDLDEKAWPRLVTRATAPPTNPTPAPAHRSGGGQTGNSSGVSQSQPNSGVSQHVSPWSGWESAADPTSTFAPVMRSTEGSSSSASAWSPPFFSSSSTAATDTRAASAASSSSLAPNAAGFAPAVATSNLTAPEPDASTSSPAPPGPGVTTTASATTSARGAGPSTASATSSAPGAGPSTVSATTSAPGAGPSTVNWVAEHWSGEQAFGGNGTSVSAVYALYPNPLWAWPERHRFGPRLFGVRLCWDCRLRPAEIVARPCGHLAICYRCYERRFLCPCCGDGPVTWLWW